MKSLFVTELDSQYWHKLQNDLITQGFEIYTPRYTEFAAKKPGISVTLYASGKLVVQGKKSPDFITLYLEPEILQSLAYSHPETVTDMTPRIGVDEAGKGDYFGPLCTSAVYGDTTTIPTLLKLRVGDSKTLSDEKVLKIAPLIEEQLATHTLILRPPKYNELYSKCQNVNKLLAWSHATCIKHLTQKTHCSTVLIDQFGHKSLVKNALERQSVSVDLEQKHKAESDIVVAAASIVARAAFLRELRSLSEYYSLPLPKGASNHVITAAKTFIHKYSPQELPLVAKKHFKTTQAVLA